MKKIIISNLLLVIIILQSCIVYQKTSVSLDVANNKGKVKVERIDGKKLIYNNLYMTRDTYYAEVKESQLMEDGIYHSHLVSKPIDSNEIKYIYLQNTKETRNILSPGLLGNFYTGLGIRYERIVYKNNFMQVLPQVGLTFNLRGFIPDGFVGSSVSFGKKNSKVAIGGSYLIGGKIPIFNLEYRYQQKIPGFYFSIGAYYAFDDIGNTLLPGIALGKTF